MNKLALGLILVSLMGCYESKTSRLSTMEAVQVAASHGYMCAKKGYTELECADRIDSILLGAHKDYIGE